MTERLLLINADDPEEARVAVVEDGRLEELYVQAGADLLGKGAIYVGRVQNVERGMGAAFVDLGSGVTGFLHESDVALRPAAEPGRDETDGDAASPEPPPPAAASEPAAGDDVPTSAAGADAAPPGEVPAEEEAVPTGRHEEEPRRIQDLVKPGDRLLVQIVRGPVGRKGPMLTTRISLAGRTIVLLANSTRSGVSRRIESQDDRRRMRTLLGGLALPAGMAAILRTASHGRAKEDVQADLDSLFRLWEDLKGRLLEGGEPRLVHAENDLALRAVRDVLPVHSTRIVVDDPGTAERVREAIARLAPRSRPEGAEPAPPAPTSVESPPEPPPTPPPPPIGPEAEPEEFQVSPADAAAPPALPSAPAPLPPAPEAGPVYTVEVHAGKAPLFHAYGVEPQVEDAFRRTIRLPSGGSIVIDPTEALVAVDVNSGRLVGEEDLEATALKTNLEAVPEVARHLRLRDLGGVVVVDFIDLEKPENGRQVEQALKDALKRDRAKIRLSKIGPFGCIELTRQRIRPALESVTHVPCRSCGGTGRRRHPTSLAIRVLREIRYRVAKAGGKGGLEVRVSPPVAEVLKRSKGDALRSVEEGMGGALLLVSDPAVAYGHWSMKGLPPRPRPEKAPTQAPGRETA